MHICCAFRENMSVKIRNDTNIPGFAPYLHIALSQNSIVNDIKNFVFGPAKASVYGFGRRRKQKFVMSFTIIQSTMLPALSHSVFLHMKIYPASKVAVIIMVYTSRSVIYYISIYIGVFNILCITKYMLILYSVFVKQEGNGYFKRW